MSCCFTSAICAARLFVMCARRPAWSAAEAFSLEKGLTCSTTMDVFLALIVVPSRIRGIWVLRPRRQFNGGLKSPMRSSLRRNPSPIPNPAAHGAGTKAPLWWVCAISVVPLSAATATRIVCTSRQVLCFALLYVSKRILTTQ